MAAFTTTTNEEPVAATIRDRLRFVWTTTRTHFEKDIRYACIYPHSPKFKPR